MKKNHVSIFFTVALILFLLSLKFGILLLFVLWIEQVLYPRDNVLYKIFNIFQHKER